MAILKHIASKNASYRDAFNYLVFQHNEFTQKPILDENGKPILREEYYIDGILCKPEGFANVCSKTNKRFNKNQKKTKSNLTIISSASIQETKRKTGFLRKKLNAWE